MTTSTLLLAAIRGALVLGLALAAMPLLRRASAATRRTVLVFALAAVVVLPVASAILPALHLRGAAPAMIEPASTAPVVENIVEATSTRIVVPPSMTPHAAPSASAPATASPPSLLSLALGLWALGAVVVLVRLGVGLHRARRMARQARLVEVRHTPRGRAVEIRSSAAIDSPAVTGVLRPVVLLPRDADTWTPERRELVLAHELAHVLRCDALANIVAQVAVALHWFDPLAHLCARRLRMERELAADDRVLDSGATASRYAEHLLALATIHTDRAMPAGALAMAEPSQIGTRIRALLAPQHSRAPLGRSRAVVLGACGAALAMFVACATPDREVSPPAIPDSGARRTPPPVATDGSTIDPAIQTIVEDEIDKLTADWAPREAIVLVLDPTTGNVLAASHRGTTETTVQLAAARTIVPGSTVKPIVMAAAIDDGAIRPDEKFDTSPLPSSDTEPAIVDETPHGVIDASQILAYSSNVGMAKVFDKLGGAKTATWLHRFHFASAPAQLEDGYRGAAVAIGATLSATPLEIAGAFAALAAGGTYHAPTFVRREARGERVVSARTASTLLGMLETVTADGGTAKAARVAGVRVAGKTGTAHLGADPDGKDYYASFVGTAPLDKPRYVIFVGAETPRDGAYGGKVAAPVFSRIMTRLLAR